MRSISGTAGSLSARRNYRWDPAARLLGLIDHDFAFAVPGARFNASCFVHWRHEHNDHTLDEWEHAVLELLLHSNDLVGLAGVLADDQAAALYERGRRMRAEGRIPNLGEW
jgi:hypothetical protein